jgi:polysaccharide transporter, PST family
MNAIRTYLTGRPDVVKILSNAGWLFSDRVLRLIVTLFVSVWVARYLGTEQYGQLNLAIAYIALAMPVAKLGLDHIVVRELVETPEASGAVIGTAFWMRLLATLALLPVLIFVVNQLHLDQPIVVILTLLLGIGMVFQALETLNMWFQARVESKHSVITRNTSFLLTSALKVGAILASGSLLVFGFIYLLDIIISIILLLWVYRRRQSYQWALDWRLAKRLMRESAPLIIAGLAVSVYMRIDQIMLGQLLPVDEADTAVGVYAAAVRISEMWYFIPAALIASVFPALLESKQQSESLYRKRLQRLFNLMVLISYGFALPMTLFSGIIINVLFGAEFADAGPVLAVLVWAGVWVTLGLVRSQVLIAENATHYSMWATLAGAILNVILNVLFIPSMGVLGCAVATLASQIIAAQLTTLYFREIRSFGWMQTRAIFYPNPLIYRD